MPKRIGIITAPTGAAIKDILSTIKRRWPIAETLLFPSLVQGKEAAEDIVRNLKRTEDFDLDVIILGRGGGSIEDMWCFNEEIVARAIYDCKTPIISAVGHEIDYTISDFVSDLRAPTPTGAAEMAVPNITDFYNYLNQIYIRLNKSTSTIIKTKKDYLNSLKESYVLKNPMNIYEIKEQNFDNLLDRLRITILNILSTNKERLNNLKTSYILNNPKLIYKDKETEFIHLKEILSINMNKVLDTNINRYTILINKLDIINPLATLKRGYSVARINDRVVSDKKNLKKGDNLEIEFRDGKINAEVL
jgi:exodeoxyribonuclease VII large subunit